MLHTRLTSVKPYLALLWAGGLLSLLAGCGGGGNPGLNVPGEISGIVYDANGNIVRDAHVYVNSNIGTFSNSNGEFVVQNVSSNQVLLKATTDQDGLNYYGEQVVELFDGERTKNANIFVVRTNQLSVVQGTVHNNSGNLLKGVRVFFSSGNRSSTYAITDNNGEYRVNTLVSGFTYDVSATAAGLNQAVDTVTPNASSSTELDLVMGSASDPVLPAPTGLGAIAWTTPTTNGSFAVGSLTLPGQAEAYEQVKRLLEPGRRVRGMQPKVSGGGNPIEVELTWNGLSDRGLLGYGVYRRLSGGGTPTAIDFLKDPLATLFADNDDAIVQSQAYDYALTSLNSSYLDGSNHGESALSGFVSVTTLSDLPVNNTTFGPTTFHWVTTSGATSYVVMVFDRYPSLGVNPIWASGHVGGNSLVYGGPGLTNGNTYYFVITGFANSDTSRTICPVLQFTAQ